MRVYIYMYIYIYIHIGFRVNLVVDWKNKERTANQKRKRKAEVQRNAWGFRPTSFLLVCSQLRNDWKGNENYLGIRI